MPRIVTALAVTVVLGLASRLYPIGWYAYDKSLGDVLYAAAAYLMLAIVCQRLPIPLLAALSLLICLAVELSKLSGIPLRYQHIIIVRWLLGTTFSWHNVGCYAVGVAGIALLDWWILRPGQREAMV
jgi:hypothetical protein